MKKAIKKTCVVLLLFALLASQVAASYSETGTLNEGTSAISAAERYLSNWAYNSYMYADKNLTLGTVLDAEVDPAKRESALRNRGFPCAPYIQTAYRSCKASDTTRSC